MGTIATILAVLLFANASCSLYLSIKYKDDGFPNLLFGVFGVILSGLFFVVMSLKGVGVW
jgi:hypothetical protein